MAAKSKDVEVSLAINARSSLRGLENDLLRVKRFLGVPYALPPTGEYRFTKPRALPDDYEYGKGSLDCKKFRAVCPQPIYKLNGNAMSRPPKSTFSEDCLYLNIWLPSGRAPDEGWPVLAWIHGGWYQIGNPLQGPDNDPSELISARAGNLQAIVIAIGYRLNLFGFLATKGIKGNLGLWDQRLGLEWIHQNISKFGGNKDNITIAGLSAGANSVHQQINYEFFQSKSGPIFHRAIMYSNAISSQPKQPDAAEAQFNELCKAFAIDSGLSLDDKLHHLRKLTDTELAEKIMSLEYHTFRVVTDEEFVSPNLIRHGQGGQFAAEFARRGFKLIIGEVENEETVYEAVNSPSNRATFLPELENYYSGPTARALFQAYPFPSHADEIDAQAWHTHFGKIVAACQVRSPTRCLVSQLLSSDAGIDTSSVFRYRISMRLKMLSDLGIPESFGIGHGMDQGIWWYQKRLGYRPEEETAVRAWLEPWRKFIHGEQEMTWGTTEMLQYRRLLPDGGITIERDAYWEEYRRFTEILMPSTTSEKL